MSTVDKTLYAHKVDMGGTKVRQPIPTNNVDQVDPFILLHHHAGIVKPDTNPKTSGVGPHPHRGFSPVTFIYKGSTHHRDSRGNDSVVHEGGAQWMNAGMGIIHSERPSKEMAQNGGETEIIQLWVNTPKAHKMDQPDYQAIEKEDAPVLNALEGDGNLSIISGEIAGLQGPVKSKLPITSAMGDLKAGSMFSLDVPVGHNAMIYLLDGSLKVDGHGLVDALNLVTFKKGSDKISFTAVEDTRILYLTGKPIEEPIESYGPFVMNNQTEIMEAMRDYQMGKMGVLIEEF
ncbi:MAG: pirin family protein [bacterium]|nr:pirin family protein [bacterium]